MCRHESLNHLGGGTVEIGTVKKQSEEVVMKGVWTVLIVSRPEEKSNIIKGNE